LAFDPLSSGEVTAGKPIAAITQEKIRTNFNDHEARVETLEGSILNFLPIIFGVNGYYGKGDNVLKTMASTNMTITGVRILINTAGTSGQTQIDIQRKRAGVYESIFAHLPTISWTEGNNALSTAGLLDFTKVDIQPDDILRLDIKDAQVRGFGFVVRVDYTR
jgi:hypothetical protein